MGRRRAALTHIDLVAMLSVLVFLAVLILPAIQRKREAARQVQCALNQRQLAMGVLQYCMRRLQFPGWGHTRIQTNNNREQIGWVPQLFDYIDQRDLAQALVGGITTKTGEKMYQRDLKILHCAADSPDYNAPLWSELPPEKGGCGKPAPANATKSKRPTSYAVNAGRPDEAMGKPDDPRFALFHDKRDIAKNVDVGFDEITDGKAQTMMLTENISTASTGRR